MSDHDTSLEALRQRVKGELRKRMRALRNALPAEARRLRSQKACEQVLSLAAFERAHTVLAYAALPGELDPSDIVEAAWSRGKQVVLPRTLAPHESHPGGLTLHLARQGEVLQPGAFGVPEPPATAPSISLPEMDLTLVPALALDPRGHRIGYGQGHYDRLLATHRDAYTVGLAYDFQLVAEVPDTVHDVPLSLVVTDRRMLNPAET